MAIEWTNEYSVGVKEIDGQHKELFNKANSLFEAMGKGKGKEEVGKIIQFLEDYTVKHFKDEEELMKKHNYPGYFSQKKEHDSFMQEFSKIKKQYTSDGANLNIVVTVERQIVDWLTKHIKKSDKQIGDFIKTRT